MWTFAVANSDNPAENTNTGCPCLNSTFRGVVPNFIGEDYYCETGSTTRAQRCYYFNNPLWDGEGCEGENECCDRGGPWFCKQLPQPTQDDIEMRVCTNSEYRIAGNFRGY